MIAVSQLIRLRFKNYHKLLDRRSLPTKIKDLIERQTQIPIHDRIWGAVGENIDDVIWQERKRKFGYSL